MTCHAISKTIYFITTFSLVLSTTLIKRNRTGVECEWQGVTGTCVNYWNCLTNAIDAHNGDPRPPVCWMNGAEVVACCTSCHLVANISDLVFFKGAMLIKTGQKSKDKCLEYIKLYQYPCYDDYGDGRVSKEFMKNDDCFAYEGERWLAAGGEDAYRREYPHMALLGYGEDVESSQWLCGGSIISERYILTAGHCATAPFLGNVSRVALGILKRSDPQELWKIYDVEAFIPHPEYHPPSKYNDIALIKTKTRIIFGDTVLPACLPYDNDKLEAKEERAFATGWGALGHRSRLADVLQKVLVTRFQQSECVSQYPVHRHLARGFDPVTQMCYGDKEAVRDTCEGDSGGPLHWWGRECPSVVFGVTSAGYSCGFPGEAGLYTRVQHYVPWIESVVWP